MTGRAKTRSHTWRIGVESSASLDYKYSPAVHTKGKSRQRRLG